MQARTRMRTQNRKLKTVLPVIDCPRVHERSVSADLKRADCEDEIVPDTVHNLIMSKQGWSILLLQ